MENKEKDIHDDLKLVAPIAALMDSEGGMIIFKSLLSVVISDMNNLCDTYTSKSHNELLAVIANMKANRDIAKAMSQARSNKEFLEDELKKILEQ